MKNYYLGGDVSKGYADFIIIDEKRKIAEEGFQLDDTHSGHSKLYTILKDFFSHHPEAVLYCAVESTGGYENNWVRCLHRFQSDMNLMVSKLNPSGVKYNSQAELRRITTDKLSALSIAEYLLEHPGKVSYEQTDHFFPLRRQWKFMHLLIKQRVQIYNQLEKIVYSSNTELLSYCKGGMPQWILNLLKQYPTAAMLSRAKAKTVAKIPYISHKKAEELINQAKRSVSSSLDDATAFMVTSMVEQIEMLSSQISLQDEFIAKKCQMPEVKLLKSFKGIGDYSAIGLMLEIGNPERFPSAKHLASYFGLHPIFHQSGDKMQGVHMSKQGRKEARYLLYNVALAAIVHNEMIRELYAAYVRKGKSKGSAIGIIMHKILRIIYGMLKHQEKYNPEKDRLNREKQQMRSPVPKKEEGAVDKTRRYQKPDNKAPISRRQDKKRKEKELSQNEISSFSAGSDPFSS